MKAPPRPIARILLGMREAYSKGENAMEWCRNCFRRGNETEEGNDLLATLVAYDLQAGTYISAARADREKNRLWCRQLADLLSSVIAEGDSILEVGVGEATTLAGVLLEIRAKLSLALGFDVSWSRASEGKKWLMENDCVAELFVADLMNIPLADASVDVVYSSHSLEPNRGKEADAIRECLRVARKAVVLVEPIYELASREAQARIRSHGYVEGLRETAARLGAKVSDYRLLDYTPNPLNPSGVVHLTKVGASDGSKDQSIAIAWRCPITAVALEAGAEFFYAREVGLAYPVLRGIPMLRAEHVIVASKLESVVGE